MDERNEFKDALWDAIVNVFYEYNGKRGTRFGLEEVEEVLKDNKKFFEADFDEDDEGDDTYYDPENPEYFEDDDFEEFI